MIKICKYIIIIRVIIRISLNIYKLKRERFTKLKHLITLLKSVSSAIFVVSLIEDIFISLPIEFN